MPTYINEDEGQQPFEKHPTGMVQAVLVYVADIGVQKGSYQGKPKNRRKVVLFWETAEKQADGKPFVLWKIYTASMGENSNLRADLMGWNGKDFTTDELKRFDVDSFLGRNCLLNIVHTEDGKYANITGITPIMKNMPVMKPINTDLADGLKKWLEKKRSEALDSGEGGNGTQSASDSDDLPEFLR